ncbi:MAG: hypothetical protein ACSHXL_04605 [Bacteroidota bacterium]
MKYIKKLKKKWRKKEEPKFGMSSGAGNDLEIKRERRNDLMRFEIDEGLVVDIFWKVLPIGKGPALSLYVMGHEAITYDCFGPGEGHFHAKLVTPKPVTETRIFYPEATSALQIERTMFELKHNAAYYLERHPNQDVRECV